MKNINITLDDTIQEEVIGIINSHCKLSDGQIILNDSETPIEALDINVRLSKEQLIQILNQQEEVS